MRKLTIKENNRKDSIQKLSQGCNCKYRCRANENSYVLESELFISSTYGSGGPLRLDTEI